MFYDFLANVFLECRLLHQPSNLDILSLHPILFHVRSRSACVATFLLPPWKCQQQQGAPDMLRTEYRLLDDEVKPAETVAVVLRPVSCNFTFNALPNV